MASADKAVLTWMSMGENDRWLGGAGEVETDGDSDCLLSHSAVTHTPPRNQIYDIDIVNRLKLVWLLIPDTQLNYLSVVVQTRPVCSPLRLHTHIKAKAEFYRHLYNSVRLTGLSRLNVIKVVTTTFLHWVFTEADSAGRWGKVFLYVVTLWKVNATTPALKEL